MEDLIKAAYGLTDYNSVREFLYGLRYHGAKYGLSRMLDFSRELGDPQNELTCIHVAGTNGKGSTCSMIEAILRNNGLKTGFYSSPHLIRQGERIQVNREIMTEQEIVDYTKEMVGVLLESSDGTLDNCPSFFEFMTSMGFLKFRKEAVDVAIIETGLGGRLDATNIIHPVLTVITSISLDHTQILGNDIQSIAAEKAGIIKQGIPVVIGLLPEEAEQIIRKKAEACEAPVYSVRERWGDDFNEFPVTNLEGQFQRINAAMATLVVEILSDRFSIEEKKRKEALLHIDWPGRWEKLKLNGGNQLVILDSTHNEEGARMLHFNLTALEKEHTHKPVVITGSLGDDRAKHLMEVLADYADSFYLVQPNQPRALDPDQLRACIPEHYKGEVQTAKIGDLFEYGSCKLKVKKDQPILVTGSIYLIGEVSDWVKSEPKRDQQSLQDVI